MHSDKMETDSCLVVDHVSIVSVVRKLHLSSELVSECDAVG